jgi:hypothetical protein
VDVPPPASTQPTQKLIEQPMMKHEPMTQRRKALFLGHLRAGRTFRDAALRASRCAATPKGAEATFRQAAKRDAQLALAIAEIVNGR